VGWRIVDLRASFTEKVLGANIHAASRVLRECDRAIIKNGKKVDSVGPPLIGGIQNPVGVLFRIEEDIFPNVRLPVTLSQ
jgi:hypothetical protein